MSFYWFVAESGGGKSVKRTMISDQFRWVAKLMGHIFKVPFVSNVCQCGFCYKMFVQRSEFYSG